MILYIICKKIKYERKTHTMETNLTALREKIEGFFTTEKFEDLDVSVTANERKADKGFGSITILVRPKDEKKGIMSATLYIVERQKTDFVIKDVMFVNNRTNDIIFSNASPTSIDKSEKYIMQFVTRAVDKMSGAKK